MTPLKANLSAFRNIFRFNSRAPRSEFWWVTATLFGGVVLATIIDMAVFDEGRTYPAVYTVATILFIVFYAAYILVTISVTIRRLHDMDMSGWFALLFFLGGLGFIILAIICSRQGTFGPNRFGPDPTYKEDGWEADIFG